jgi:MscS family membrane protein
VDTSNPRSTLEGFLDSVSRAYALVNEADAALAAEPPSMTIEEAREIEAKAGNLLSRAAHTFDLSDVPEALRRDVGIETALQLKEIFDRMILPPIDSVPNAEMVVAQKKAAKEVSSGEVGTARWRYPNTEIEIVEMAEGERKGQFLFSAATVRHISEYYEKIKDLPYRNVPRSLHWIAPDKTEGFYEDYISTPGYLVSRIHLLGSLVDGLPATLKRFYGEQTAWQWIGLAISVLALALAAYLIYAVLKRIAKRFGSPLDGWLMILAPIAIAIMAEALVDFFDNDLNITGGLLAIITTAGRVLALAMAAWAVYLTLKAIAETIVALPQFPDESIDASLLRIGVRVLGFLIGAWILIDGVQELGLYMIPLLAGLGVGGLAVALAAKTTIANFIGSLILFANRPVCVGEFCRYGEDPSPGWLRIGSVEEIGLHSTRLRGIDRSITTIPNAEFANMHIVNLTVRDRRLLRTTLQLRYETTPEQMRYVLVKLRELLLGHPMVTPDPARVRFTGYGPHSQDVGIFAYFRCQSEDDFLAIQEDILLRIGVILREAGTGFAIPSQTAYLARDTGPDAKRRDQAEAEVAGWRAGKKLPFPDFEDEERERLEDLLDYPPKGSPDYEPR